MLGLLPLVVVALIVAAVFAHRARLQPHLGPVGRALSLCVGASLGGLALVASTELLGLFSALTFVPVLLTWSALGIAAAVVLARGDARGLLSLPTLPRAALALWGISLALLGLVIVSAVLSPPNNYDSMAYHLMRQLFWMQQGSVDFYPTNSIRQLFMPPFCEYAQLHAMILAGSDRWSNLVQTGALAATLVGVAHLARVLGAGPFGQALAALFAITNPMAFLEGSSTKNDMMVAWLVLQTSIFALRVVELRRFTWTLVAFIGASLGLLLLAKGTAIVFALPVCLMAGVAMIRYGRGNSSGSSASMGDEAPPEPLTAARLFAPRHIGGLLGALVVIAVMAFAPNAGHFHRNNEMFGHPTGPIAPEVEGSSLYVNEHMAAWPTLASNVIRNVTLHLALPEPATVFRGWKPWVAWNEGVHRRALAMHDSLGLDPNADNTTWKGMPYKVVYFPTSEDRAGTIVHFLLAVFAPLLALPRLLRRKEADGTPRFLVGAWLVVPALGFIAFCMVFRWQPWHARLHLPLFALVAPLVGWLFDTGRWRIPGWVTAALALVWLVPTFENVGRPLHGKGNIWSTPRDSMRLNWRTKWRPGTEVAAELVRKMGAKSLGFRFGHNDIQYPIGRMVRDTLPDIEIVNVNPKPITNPRELRPTPEALVVAGPFQLERTENGRTYKLAGLGDPYAVFIRDDLYPTAPKALDRHRFLGWTELRGLKKPGHGQRVGRVDRATAVTRVTTQTSAVVVFTGRAKAPVSVWLRGSRLAEFTPSAVPTAVPISLRPGANTIELRGVKDVVFTTLRLEPQGATTPTVSGAAETSPPAPRLPRTPRATRT